MGKTVGIVFGALAVAFVIYLGVQLVDVDQTQEAQLPTVDMDVDAKAGSLPDIDIVVKEEGSLPSVDMDVDVEAGNMPEFDVDVGELKAGTTTETILVPKVVMEEEEVQVPVIGVVPPEEDGEVEGDGNSDGIPDEE